MGIRSKLPLVLVLLVFVIGSWGIFSLTKPNEDDDSARELISIIVPDLKHEDQKGKALFDANCSMCHGNNGVGNSDAGPPLIHKIYEPGHHADFAFFRAVELGVRAHHWQFGDMPPVANLKQEDVASIINYVRVVQRANGIQ